MQRGQHQRRWTLLAIRLIPAFGLQLWVSPLHLRWRQRRHLLISAHRADWKAANNYVASHLPVQIHNANAGGIRIILNVGLKHRVHQIGNAAFGVRIVQHHSKKQHSIPAHSLLESS